MSWTSGKNKKYAQTYVAKSFGQMWLRQLRSQLLDGYVWTFASVWWMHLMDFHLFGVGFVVRWLWKHRREYWPQFLAWLKNVRSTFRPDGNASWTEVKPAPGWSVPRENMTFEDAKRVERELRMQLENLRDALRAENWPMAERWAAAAAVSARRLYNFTHQGRRRLTNLTRPNKSRLTKIAA